MKLFICSLILFAFTITAHAEVKEYNLDINYKTVNYTGKDVVGMSINDSIPGPTLRFNVGDTARINVKNKLDVETSVHWHGVLLPNRQDGVPYLTTPPIMPGTTHTFEFEISHPGTYWYHSHTGLQEQRGVYGSLVFEPEAKRNDIPKIDEEYVLVLSDWTDENPHEVLRTLKRGSEYYNYKKGTIQTVWGVIQNNAITDNLKRSFMRMPPMDISDVAFDSFLMNGKEELSFESTSGKTVRLRIINAAASTYFYLNYAAGSMNVISADGVDVKPFNVDKLLIAIAETYDVIISVPENGSYEFRATAHDSSGYSSLFLGEGEVKSVADIPKPNLYKMEHGSHGKSNEMKVEKSEQKENSEDHIHQTELMDDNKVKPSHDIHKSHENMNNGKLENSHAEYGHKNHMKHDLVDAETEHLLNDHEEQMRARPLTPYDQLKSVISTALPEEYEIKEFVFNLTGDMKRFVWSINGKILDEADKIKISKGENVRFILVNKTMMHHPMHLHGHFFRVVNQFGDFSPLKHTVDVPPMGKVIIEFEANEEKDWFFHCHLLYHMMSGMARVISYEDSEIDPDIQELRKKFNHDHMFYWLDAQILSQMSEGKFVASNTRNIISAEWEIGWEDQEFETDILYSRYLSKFFSPFIGFEITNENQGNRGVIGFDYILPFLIESRTWIDWEGDLRFLFEKEFQLTRHLSTTGEIQFDTESEWESSISLSYIINKNLSLIGKYHSNFGIGGGIEIKL